MTTEVTARLDKQNDQIRASVKYPEGLFIRDAISASRWDPQSKSWVIPASPISALNLKTAANERGFVLKGDRAMRDLIALATSRVDVKAEAVLAQPEERRTDAWRHQLEAYHFANSIDTAMLNMEMGTGKSKVVIDYIQNNNIRTVAIVCPVSVINVWRSEINKHAKNPDEWAVPDLKGSVTKRAKRAKEVLKSPQDFIKVIRVNYEAAWRDPMATMLKQEKLDLVVFDEIHRIKSPSGRSSRYCAQLAKHANGK